MGLGKGVVSQTAASGSEVWEGGESGGIFYFFLRIYCSMGRGASLRLPAVQSWEVSAG